MKIALLGTGNMGKAVIAGLLRTYGENITIIAWDTNENALKGVPDVVAVAGPGKWFTGDSITDAVIIAVKPVDIASAIAPIVKNGGERIVKPLWVSIAAGTSIAALQNFLPQGVRICRAMPNMPAFIGEAMTAYSLSENATEQDNATAGQIFRSCGKAVAVPEKLMNAVTGLSGSGPAYVFLFIESLIEAGVVAGLPYTTARECALQTVIGAAKMADASPESLADLKMKVMSPAGTTASACSILEQHAFKHAIITAVMAATKRAEQLEK
jgi:pyrroline-5-carboxylate reductase